jgi:hypothetical protein
MKKLRASPSSGNDHAAALHDGTTARRHDVRHCASPAQLPLERAPHVARAAAADMDGGAAGDLEGG